MPSCRNRSIQGCNAECILQGSVYFYAVFHKLSPQGIRLKGREMALVWHEKASRTAFQKSS